MIIFFLIFVYILFFGFWLYKICTKYGYNISAYILSIYLFGAICCELIITIFPDYIKYPSRVTIFSVTTHITIIWLMLYPIVRYGNSILAKNISFEIRSLTIFSWFIAICTVSAFIASLTDMGRILLLGDFSAARNAYLQGEYESGSYVSRYGIYGYIIAMGNLISFFATFLFFLRYFKYKKKDLLSLLLLIGSFTVAVSNLAIAGRDGIIRCGLFYGFNLILFKDYISLNKNKKTVFLLLSICCLGIILFFSISLDRFSKSQEGILLAILRYAGEQFYLFSYNYHEFFDKGSESIETMFPLLFDIDYTAHNLNDRISADYSLNTFSTIAGSFVQRIGVINTLILVSLGFVVLSLILYRRSRFIHNISLSRMIAFLSLYEVMLLGYFYYMHYSRPIQLYLLACILIAYLLPILTAKIQYIRK